MLKLGNTGLDVIKLQQALDTHGAEVATDGVFGQLTEAAVKAFQLKYGLAADGVVGPLTIKALGLDQDTTTPVVARPASPAPIGALEQIHFFDVSDYQPNIDFAAAAAGGNRFCYIKATQGELEVQKYFNVHASQARAAKFPVGAYHFFEEMVDGQTQWLHFDRNAPKVAGDLVPMVDMEPNGSLTTITQEGQRNLADFLSNALTKYEYVMLYYDYYFLTAITHQPLIDLFKERDMDGMLRIIPWNAAYGQHPLISPWWRDNQRPLAWQYTDRGSVPGVGQIDSDWLYCTEEQYQKLIVKA